MVVLNAINLTDSVANLYFKAAKPDLQTLLYTTPFLKNRLKSSPKKI